MYILAKRVPDQYGFTVHGVTELDKVMEAWCAGGGEVFNIDIEDPITSQPQPAMDFSDS